jgi:hypothetical protein
MSVLQFAISLISQFNAWVFCYNRIALIGGDGAVLLAISSNFYRTAVIKYDQKGG